MAVQKTRDASPDQGNMRGKGSEDVGLKERRFHEVREGIYLSVARQVPTTLILCSRILPPYYHTSSFLTSVVFLPLSKVTVFILSRLQFRLLVNTNTETKTENITVE